MKRPKFITIKWYDHVEDNETWSEATKPADLHVARVESRGWLISENDAVIELSNHRPMDNGDAEWGSRMRILKAAIFFRSDTAPKKLRTKPVVPVTDD